MNKSSNIKYFAIGCSALFLLLLILLLLLFFVIAGGFMAELKTQNPQANCAVVEMNGAIVPGQHRDILNSVKSVKATDFSNLIKKINKDNNVKGIIIRVNSPGGTPVATEEVARAIDSSRIPVVAVIGETAASGAYWAAIHADHVIASKLSITGSIGVRMSSFGLEELIKFLKINNRRMVAGEYKDISSPFRKPKEEEEAHLQSILQEIHEEFIRVFMLKRKLQEDIARKIANGLIYTGKQALELGMIDEIGGMDEAIKWLEDQTKITMKTYQATTAKSFLERLGGAPLESALKDIIFQVTKNKKFFLENDKRKFTLT